MAVGKVLCFSNNGDMFKLLFEEITVKNLNFTCRWMPTHSVQKGTELPPDVSPLDVIGNDFADKQADLAAAYHVISLNASSIALWYGCLAWRIQRRNVCILASLEARKRGEPPNKQEMILPKLPDPEALFPFSSHVAFSTGTGFIRCARCNQSYESKHEYVRKWLITDCPMINSDLDRPRPLALELLHIGSRGIHPSHHINTFRGLVYCRTCGAKAGNTAAGFIKLLAVPCRAPQSNGKDNIKRLAAGKLPRGAKSWPCDDITDVQTNKRFRRELLSAFALQVLSDHPGLSESEAKVVAKTFFKCADFASSMSVPGSG